MFWDDKSVCQVSTNDNAPIQSVGAEMLTESSTVVDCMDLAVVTKHYNLVLTTNDICVANC